MKIVSTLKKLAISVTIAATTATSALSCTGITLTAMDGSVVYGRTMEWGAFDLLSRVMIVPRGHSFVALMDDGEPGRASMDSLLSMRSKNRWPSTA